MFTLEQLSIILTGLDSLRAVNKRARNNSRNPEFGPIYDKIIKDIEETETAVREARNKHIDKTKK